MSTGAAGATTGDAEEDEAGVAGPAVEDTEDGRAERAERASEGTVVLAGINGAARGESGAAADGGGAGRRAAVAPAVAAVVHREAASPTSPGPTGFSIRTTVVSPSRTVSGVVVVDTVGVVAGMAGDAGEGARGADRWGVRLPLLRLLALGVARLLRPFPEAAGRSEEADRGGDGAGGAAKLVLAEVGGAE